MTNIKSFRLYLEKNASVHGDTIKSITGFVKKHPWITLGTIGGTLGAASLIQNVSSAVLPTYHILNEQRKKGIMDNQTEMLKKIHESIQNKNKPVENRYSVPQSEPLA